MESGIIWVLGGKSLKADANIPWKKEIPNMTNCDTLIIDMNTIPTSLKGSIPSYEIREYILYSMMSKKDTYVILSPKFESDMLPIIPIIEEIKNCIVEEKEKWGSITDELKEYYKYVEYCPFYIYNFNLHYFWNMINPSSDWKIARYDFTDRIRDLTLYYPHSLRNNANQYIGRSIFINLKDRYDNIIFTTGKLHFIPPTTKISTTDAIDVIINSLVGAEIKEDEPKWIVDILLPNVKKLESEIKLKKSKINRINEEIKKEEEEKYKIAKHLRLLWTESTPLENGVRDAFQILGFDEIRSGRSKELEDWVIDFKSINEVEHGVLEVKGSTKGTSMADIDQCHKWVRQYRVKEGKKVKGIFIPNQFRRSEKFDSIKRITFPPNQIEDAQDVNVCILPAVELFKAVIEKFKGNTIDRNEIEKRILEANPVCNLTGNY